MKLQSAGTLLYRAHPEGMQVLIVKPAGPVARYGWSIPKGLPEPGESLEDAARRETFEEAGVMAAALQPLGFIDYVKSKKRVHCFYGQAPRDVEPRKASWEISEARFVSLEEAKRLLHPDQRPLVELLLAKLPQ